MLIKKHLHPKLQACMSAQGHKLAHNCNITDIMPNIMDQKSRADHKSPNQLNTQTKITQGPDRPYKPKSGLFSPKLTELHKNKLIC